MSPADPAPGCFTLVALHAHPDDEALLTGGTLARAAAEGHRVVLVVATLGEAGLTSPRLAGDLGARRRRELDESARAIGVARVVSLGYADSGSSPSAALIRTAGARGPFSRADVEQVAQEVASVLTREGAHVLTSYDPHGGYGHPDHLQIHRVGRRAAQVAGTPVLLEATLDRDLLQVALRVVRRVVGRRRGRNLLAWDLAYSPRPELTHRVDVRAWLPEKRRALRAHASQTVGGSGIRTVALLSRLPRPVAGWVLGSEWFVEVGREPSVPLLDDVFASLRATP